MKGGKQPGAGRPKSPPRPPPVSWRPTTQAIRDKYLELGGARWLNRTVQDAIENKVGV